MKLSNYWRENTNRIRWHAGRFKAVNNRAWSGQKFIVPSSYRWLGPCFRARWERLSEQRTALESGEVLATEGCTWQPGTARRSALVRERKFSGFPPTLQPCCYLEKIRVQKQSDKIENRRYSWTFVNVWPVLIKIPSYNLFLKKGYTARLFSDGFSLLGALVIFCLAISTYRRASCNLRPFVPHIQGFEGEKIWDFYILVFGVQWSANWLDLWKQKIKILKNLEL